MKKGIVFTVLLLSSYLLLAQGKQDANWCFGKKVGLNFSSISPTVFTNESFVYEAAASVSNYGGGLLFYLTTSPQDLGGNTYSIVGSNNSTINNGDDILLSSSCTNCAMFLPAPGDSNKFYLLHLQAIQDVNCSFCYNFYSSTIERIGLNWQVTSKNQILSNYTYEEKLAAVKHANGYDWWVILHEKSDNGPSCTDMYIKYLVSKNGINGPYTQNIGSNRCGQYVGFGEMKPSENGNRIASCTYDHDILELLSFDRCNGLLSNHKFIENSGLLNYVYSVEFSKSGSFLYASSLYPSNYDTINKLVQFDLRDSLSISNSEVIWNLADTIFAMGQLERASNDKIYFSLASGDFFVSQVGDYSDYLGVINFPDSLGSLSFFEPLGLPLGNAVQNTLSLPNMPNYRLGPLSIYQANAGKDTVICLDDTVNIKSVPIGQAPVPGVQYQWVAGDSIWHPDSSYTFVNPSQTTTYVLEITDTSITNACQSRYDTVVVEVKECFTGIQEPGKSLFQVYPNPNQGNFTIELEGNISTGKLEVIDLQGRVVHTEAISTGERKKVFNLELTEGLYLIRFSSEAQVSQIQKLIISH